ncbi:MAG: hypothetical protein Kow00128_22260 [Deltaproteobacteria bacterium]
MSLFQAKVGIDPSGRRLAIAAVRGGIGRAAPVAPPVCHSLGGERESDRVVEAEGLLRDYVVRHRLSGDAACLCVPAEKVYTARAVFPVLRERDLRGALSLELERLFPVSPETLRFGWRRIPGEPAGGGMLLVVAAVPADFLLQWEGIASRAGLVLRGAVPWGWAMASACRAAGYDLANGASAILRETDGAVEAALCFRGEPFFLGRRRIEGESAPGEAARLLAEGMVDPPGPQSGERVTLFAPPSLGPPEVDRSAEEGVSFHPAEGFDAAAAAAMAGPGEAGEPPPVWPSLGAYGAAQNGERLDLLAPPGGGAAFRAGRVAAGLLAVLAVLLAIAWPTVHRLRAGMELRRLDAEIASQKAAVAEAEREIAELAAIRERIGVLAGASAVRGETLEILRELTERLPQGTWLTGLRVEDRKVEIDGLSPSASEIFPLLARDGRFRGVEFASPVTRQPDNLERFRIRAEFAPPASNPAGGAR